MVNSNSECDPTEKRARELADKLRLYPTLIHDRAMKYVRDSNHILLESDFVAMGSLVVTPLIELVAESHLRVSGLGVAFGVASASFFDVFSKLRHARQQVPMIIKFGLQTTVLDGGAAYVDNRNCTIMDIANETYSKRK